MDKDEFKKLLNEALEPIKKNQNKHSKSLGSLSKTAKTQAEILETLKSSVLNIETTNAVYGDMYKINDDNSRKLEKRVVVLENNAGLEAPPELTLLKVQ